MYVLLLTWNDNEDEYQSFPSSLHDIFPHILQSTSESGHNMICMHRTCFYFRYVIFQLLPFKLPHGFDYTKTSVLS